MSVADIRRILFPGFSLEVDGCRVYLFSVSRVSPTPATQLFLVSQAVECYGKTSKQFLIAAESQEEYIRKLKKEIALFKAIILGGVYDVYRSS